MSEGPPRSAEGAETVESLRAENAALKAELTAERMAKEEALKKLDEAGLDFLTSLPLRRRFESSVTDLFAHPLGPDEKPRAHLPARLALLFIDLDHFKALNDTHGHSVGDTALYTVALALKEGIRPTDFIARWGGEEVVVMLPDASEADAAVRAEGLRQSLANLEITNDKGERVIVTATFGVAAVENDGSATLAELTKRADGALYAGKHRTGGRNCVVTASAVEEERKKEPKQYDIDFG